ncbi:hypothetical protein B0O99DRAFT_632321 [Bisporella sp. PMI_857]|nr:hypothetical protein B0O99DRAFT_632321 [Bisporella sp. PMI_857]
MINVPSWLSIVIFTAATTVQAISANTSELDLLFPHPGSSFHLNDRGMAVLIALQNPSFTWNNTWSFTWQLVTSPALSAALGTTWQTAGIDTNHDIFMEGETAKGLHPIALQSSPYIGLSHEYWPFTENSTAAAKLPGPGVYDFTWMFEIGPWCAFYPQEPATTLGASQWWSSRQVRNGSFPVTLLDPKDAAATYPALPTETCGGVFAAAVSVESTTTWSRSWVTRPSDYVCAVTASVTESAEPCAVTLDAALAGSVRSIMAWTTASGAVKTSGTSLGTDAPQPTTTGALTDPSALSNANGDKGSEGALIKKPQGYLVAGLSILVGIVNLYM